MAAMHIDIQTPWTQTQTVSWADGQTRLKLEIKWKENIGEVGLRKKMGMKKNCSFSKFSSSPPPAQTNNRKTSGATVHEGRYHATDTLHDKSQTGRAVTTRAQKDSFNLRTSGVFSLWSRHHRWEESRMEGSTAVRMRAQWWLLVFITCVFDEHPRRCQWAPRQSCPPDIY